MNTLKTVKLGIKYISVISISLINCFSVIALEYRIELPKIYEVTGNTLINSEEYHFNENRGKYLYIDFWASWCGPCKESFPFMEKLKNNYSNKGFNIVAINIDSNKKDAFLFLKENKISFLNLYDPKGEIAKLFNVSKIPTSILIDPFGRVLMNHSGFNSQYAEKLKYILDIKVINKPVK